MYSIVISSVISFLAAFGLIELIRFFYLEWRVRAPGIKCYTVVPVKNKQDAIECSIRNVIFRDDTSSILVVDMGSSDDTRQILYRLQQRHPHITIMTREEYIDFIVSP